MIIDEIQRVPELFLSLKKLVDDDRSRRIILTGSADVMLMPEVGDSLAGRIESHSLWPLSIDEMAGKKSDFLKKLRSPENQFQPSETSWDKLISDIKRGGYPEIIHRKTDRSRARWFDAYLNSLLQKDIRDLANIDGLTFLPRILHLLSTRVGSTVNMSDIARLAKIKNTSFQRYVALLKQLFLIVEIPAWTPNEEGQFVKSPKIFLNDTGLLCQLNNDADSLLNDRMKAGHLLENFVAMEIMKQLTWQDEKLLLKHFSMYKGSEVDLIIEDQRKRLFGIEIKSKYSLKSDDFKGLRKLQELSGNSFQKGIILYSGNQVIPFGNDLWAVPIGNL